MLRDEYKTCVSIGNFACSSFLTFWAASHDNAGKRTFLFPLLPVTDAVRQYPSIVNAMW
jgi:hypothetical protein